MRNFTIETSRIFDAPVADVWAVVSDAGGYHEVVDTLAFTEITSGNGEGMVRHCVDTKDREWNEVCSLWHDGHRFQMTVDVATYPTAFRAIFSEVVGTWTVEPAGDGAQVTMRFDGATKLGPIGWAAVAVMGKDSVTRGILAGYERQIAARLAN